MQRVNFLSLLVLLSIFLSACPYKEFYKYAGNDISQNGFKIYPITVFFSERKGVFNSGFVIRIVNTTSVVHKFRFDSSFLDFQREKININGVIFATGNPTKPDSELILEPQMDTLVSLRFEGRLPLKVDSVTLNVLAKNLNVQMPYKRIGK